MTTSGQFPLTNQALYAIAQGELVRFPASVEAYWELFETAEYRAELWQWDYEADASTTIFISRSRGNIRILPGQSVSIDDTLLGYGLSVGLIGTPDPNLEFGVWGVYQRNREGENIASVRAGVGLRF